ncbi:ras-related protein rab7-like [Drosophila busckii]|uniref:ras-related protein rab7-like n=1 Tax=Drosophila busckii TaxID=30019 RepID=UPI00083EBA66|nr:ras-related protein rab7-like [Drosophila busckii]
MSHQQKVSKNEKIVKVLLLGDSFVGKTSIINRYVLQIPTKTYKATVGVDICSKHIIVNFRVVTLQLWDTAGQERFHTLGIAFYRGADCCALVFDVTSPSSFKNLQTWHDEFLILSNPRNPENFPFVVLGNKVDLENRQVSRHQAEKWCKLKNMPYFETSTLDGLNVKQAFLELAEKAVEQMEEELDTPDFPDVIKLDQKSYKRKKCYC